ncbi:MAG: putative peptidoglycan D,D-transpeptidase PenA [Chlamydiales bacterium]|nr:putative peptidoglycan D,D-transpeptidase PenA [Chlamydiales bacterium]MCH9620015.1 putative peptidoglycan D,D-transpeptidase PenA [Chlamydiales bacterium]MCH9622881.1 putative peptidoglycan D,D-transpeptidase PenA [Chlamydiales bacterium]
MGMFALFSLLIAQYFKIQVLESEKWSQKADAQHKLVVKEPFKRGAFYTNSHGKWQPLVFDVTRFHLYIDPKSIPQNHREVVADQLIEFASLPESIRLEFERKSRSRRLTLDLERGEKERILQWWIPYARRYKIPSNAIYFLTDYKRSYPCGKLLGQVLHTIREMKDEETGEGLPTGGLESYFNDLLKGQLGERRLLRSPLNHLEVDEVIKNPENGADIYLTIDHTVQAIVEEELAKAVSSSGAKGGWAILMEAKRGSILAMAQVPTFDPTKYRDYFNDPTLIEETKAKAITDPFEIGSIMKPITVGIALNANQALLRENRPKLFDPEEKIDVTRSIFPGRRKKPLRDLPRHKAVNMYMALQKSSNVYMAQLAERIVDQLGAEWYRNQLVENFGFEQRTGVELPAETLGLVPSSKRRHPNGAPEWSVPTPFSLSIGYNLLATSLQMLRAVAVFPSGGYLVQPTLIRKIVKDEEVVYSQVIRRKKVMEKEDAYAVGRAMKYSTKPGGTGRLASVSGYTEAGKTGSAEKIVGGIYSKKKHISSFIGFAPARFDETANPLVLIVSIDEPAPIILENGIKTYLGGRCAAPVFQQVMRRTLEYLGVPRDDPFGYPVGDPRYHSEKGDWFVEVRALKELYEQWNKK